MMFSLAIFDKLTPGALTGGAKIAGTGTIASDGTVGPIGGIQQKLYGARDGGARWFLAPAVQLQRGRGHVPDGLSVVKVVHVRRGALRGRGRSRPGTRLGLAAADRCTARGRWRQRRTA